MKAFKFKVVQTEVYSDIIEIKAESEEKAEELLNEELEACPIDVRSNRLNNIDIDITLIEGV